MSKATTLKVGLAGAAALLMLGAFLFAASAFDFIVAPVSCSCG